MKTKTEMKAAKSSRDVLRAMEAASTATGVSIQDMLAPGRHLYNITDARAIAIYLCARKLNVRGTEIAKAFGRSSPCVSHSCSKVEERVKCDKKFSALVSQSVVELN